ncbi:hypothetical protein LK994_01735 [Ferruginibacter lapsinanis]|uniref:hypothetical protein n=1 Tax=Ferruginibacter lapsinanis TaxID=563172 RepID=UPI001E620F8E|nr:hypothetical protein [Ferruginibacter lapsinanis]UEG50194.1 hypothetical protein LK994_01735 [Ferruginibacter lapsinanis]
MFFNLFGKKEDSGNNNIFSDKAYINAEGKRNGCLQLAKEQPETVFIAWFSDTAKEYKDFFTKNGVEESRVIEVRHLHTSKLENKTPVFLEHYPLHEKELELVANWSQQKIIVYNSLDEALFKHFGSDKMIPLIKMLGMKEDEAIEHSYVTQSITRGQQKIADMVTLEQSASSQAEWMERNIKG